jgi:hypothetical protein
MTTQTTPAPAPLSGNDITAGDVTASAAAHRQAAGDAAGRAARDRAEAEQLLAAARAEAARIIGEAEAAARPLTDAAAIADRDSAELTVRAQWLGSAAAEAVKAEEADARAKALEDERADLSGRQAELGRRLATLAAERRDLEPQLGAARDSGDLDAMTSIRNRLDSIRDLEATLQAQRAPLIGRVAEIGDGTETLATHPLLQALPPLARARQDARQARYTLRRILNDAFPDRPEAVADKGRQDWEEGRRFAAERAQQAPRDRPRQTFVVG